MESTLAPAPPPAAPVELIATTAVATEEHEAPSTLPLDASFAAILAESPEMTETVDRTGLTRLPAEEGGGDDEDETHAMERPQEVADLAAAMRPSQRTQLDVTVFPADEVTGTGTLSVADFAPGVEPASEAQHTERFSADVAEEARRAFIAQLDRKPSPPTAPARALVPPPVPPPTEDEGPAPTLVQDRPVGHTTVPERAVGHTTVPERMVGQSTVQTPARATMPPPPRSSMLTVATAPPSTPEPSPFDEVPAPAEEPSATPMWSVVLAAALIIAALLTVALAVSRRG